jgi:hypothetical protein
MSEFVNPTTFEAAFDALTAELEVLKASGEYNDVCLAPICGGTALVKGRLSGAFLLRFGEDLFIRFPTKAQAIAAVDRAVWRLRLDWLTYLEKSDDNEGLRRYEEKMGRGTNAPKDVSDDEFTVTKEMVYFEPYESKV